MGLNYFGFSDDFIFSAASSYSSEMLLNYYKAREGYSFFFSLLNVKRGELLNNLTSVSNSESEENYKS